MTRLAILAAIILAAIAILEVARRSPDLSGHQPEEDQYRWAVAGAHQDMALLPLRNRGLV